MCVVGTVGIPDYDSLAFDYPSMACHNKKSFTLTILSCLPTLCYDLMTVTDYQRMSLSIPRLQNILEDTVTLKYFNL